MLVVIYGYVNTGLKSCIIILLLSAISLQFKLSWGDAVHTSGYEASHDASSVDEAYSFVVIFSVNTTDDSPRRVIRT